LPRQDWERMIGFSIPEGNALIIVTYDGLVRMNLESPVTASIDERYPEGRGIYDMATSEVRYEGQTFQLVGVHGGAPIVWSPRAEQIVLGVEEDVETPDGRRVRATPEVSTLLVEDANRHASLAFTFHNLSRDWQRATFSRDGNFLILGMPYAIHVFRRTVRDALSQ
jgi:hypothetical protein